MRSSHSTDLENDLTSYEHHNHPPNWIEMLSPPISTSNTPDQPKEEKERIVAEVRIPDGGLRAWSVVLGGFLNFITAFGTYRLDFSLLSRHHDPVPRQGRVRLHM